ncbi:taste receptor type 2 member 62-like [Ochotona princeps]|uniref:taste receptor type 2 member 62-like n=1 Tax=Ochotona princeps TaxID=9978 RepID=UPI00032B0975|nr:taste receptor type 2 member 62-like [Ochotona princeps]
MSLTFIFMIIFCLESLASMLQNGFMVTMLGREWVRCRALPTGEMIVACLAASRFCVHMIATLNNFLSSFNFSHVFILCNVFWNFFNSLTFWLTACLALLYCVKISSFSHPIFFWLKWRVSRSGSRMLLGSLIICVLSFISSLFGSVITVQLMVSQSFYGNNTPAYGSHTFFLKYFIFHEAFFLSIPFLLFLVCTIFLMYSLCRHLRQMKGHRPGPRDPSTQVHIMALKSLACSLIFHMSYYLFLIIDSVKATRFYGHWPWAWEVTVYAGLFLQSTILMLSSPKLRKALKKRIQDIGHCRS